MDRVEAYEPIILVGAGNLATRLGLRLAEKNIQVLQVYNRTPERASALASRIGAQPVADIRGIDPAGRLFILAVADQAVPELAAALTPLNAPERLFVHTSGSLPSTILAPAFSRYGVFYPLQTFTKNRTPDFDEIPVCVHAAAEADLRVLEALGQRVSRKIYRINDEERAAAHIAAVFANNFTNHLYGIAERLLAENGLPFDLIRPLILETALKVQSESPAPMQTGPARRNDRETIRRHLEALGRHPEWASLYRLITESIQHEDNRLH
ncbi:MAG: DUF2520 domain-containing protein [Lewinellaceae bacterium]|nr:DUF2520 domain-containing protein [Lewinellaceae bacterium]